MTTRTDLTTQADRRTARLAAVLFLVTWVTSVGALPLYGGSSYDPATRLAGRDSVLTASLLEVVLAVAVVGTSLALYPLLRAHGRGAALGYVALRGLEASVILVGVVAVLPAVVHDWTFLVGPGLINPVNATVLAVLLWRRRLVPRFIPLLGLVGSVLVLGQNLAVMFGLTGTIAILVVPLFAWEISLAAYLLLRGIRPAQPTPR